MNINYDSPFNFKPILTITPASSYWENGTWKFNMPEITAGAASQPSWIDIILHGNTALTLVNAKADGLNYLKLFGSTEQRNIPAEYTQVAYIGATGTQWIDIGINGTQITRFVVKGTCHPRGYSNTQLLGGTSATATTFFGARVTDTTSSWYCMNSNTFLGDPVHLSIIDCTINSAASQTGTLIDTVTGTTETFDSLANSDWAFSNSNLLLFGGASNRISPDATCYELELYTSLGLAFNGIPCRRNSDSVLGMYDTVTGNFLTNQGTGTFTAGADVAPSPTTPMDIVCNNGVVKARHQSGLPLGYAQVEYLQTDGNSYIDTGIAVPTTYKWELTLNSRGTNTSPYWGYSNTNSYTSATSFYSLGANGTSGISGITLSVGVFSGTSETSQTSFYNADGITSAGTLGGDTPHTIKCDGSFVFTADNTPMTQVTSKTFTDFTPTGNAYLFARNTPSILKSGDGARIHTYKVWNASGVLVQNLVPCTNSSNVAGFYDTVSGTFFTNAGTGTFTTGNTVSDPVEIYTDGTVETVEVRGKNLFDKNQEVLGGWYDNTGNFNQSSTTGHTEDYIYVKSNTTYTINQLGHTATDSGKTGVYFYDINKNWINRITSYNTSSFTFTTPSNCYYVRFQVNLSSTASNVAFDKDICQVELGSTATTYEEYFNGGSATAENLFKVGEYKDEQSVIDGGVTRNIGIKVLDGTETYSVFTGSGKTSVFLIHIADTGGPGNGNPQTVTSSHFISNSVSTGSMGNLTVFERGDSQLEFFVRYDLYDNNVDGFKAWIIDQYQAGQPVIVVYPLATATTETVTAQSLTTQAGTNIVEITQASIENLELEVSYKAGVAVTITEVENAQLDNNVEVTIQ